MPYTPEEGPHFDNFYTPPIPPAPEISSYVPDAAPEVKGIRLIHAAMGELPIHPEIPLSIREEMLEAMSPYPSAELIRSAREAVIQYWGLDDLKPGEKMPHVTFAPGGSLGALEFVLPRLGIQHPDRNKGIIALAPHFPPVKKIAMMLGGEDVYYAIEPHSMDAIDAIQQYIESRDKIFGNYTVYFSDPNSPTGQSVSRAHADALITTAELFGDTTIVDRAFGDWKTKEDSAIHLTKSRSNLIDISSTSKGAGYTGGPGIIVMSEKLGQRFKEWEHEFPARGNDLVLIKWLYGQGGLQNFMDEWRPKIRENKLAFMKACSDRDIKIAAPTDPNVPIILIDGEDPDFFKWLLPHGVEAAPGQGFGSTHYRLRERSMAGRFARITIPVNAEDIEPLADHIAFTTYRLLRQRK
jgi:histidinol-phosphate/aromatic aminotransferase/cobyric acid decarboxylase-like protein